MDAQNEADTLFARSLATDELLALLAKGQQGKTVVVIDACFSGKTPSGQPLIKGLQPLVAHLDRPHVLGGRAVVLSAAASDQFAGPLPRAAKMRPAFSYLALGALRGWAADGAGKVTAQGVIDFARRALSLAHDRTQTPELVQGAPATVLGIGRERAPDLGKIDRAESSPRGGFQVTELPNLSRIEAPKSLDLADPKGMDFRTLDVDALEKFAAVKKIDKSNATPQVKAEAWRKLAREAPVFQ